MAPAPSVKIGTILTALTITAYCLQSMRWAFGLQAQIEAANQALKNHAHFSEYIVQQFDRRLSTLESKVSEVEKQTERNKR